MATRFYLPSSSSAPPVSPTISAEWEHINTARRIMATTKAATAMAASDYSPDGSDHLVNGDAHVVQFVSAALAGQSIGAQTVSIHVRGFEVHAGNNLFLTWKLYLVNASGSPVASGTLVAIRRDDVELSTSTTNRPSKLDSATSTAVTASAGDYLVLEVGYGGTPTAATQVQGHNGGLTFGDDAASDLVTDGTTTALNPWLELATTTLTFAGSPQSLTVPHVGSVAAILVPTVSPGAVGLTVPAIAAASAVFAPVVSEGAASQGLTVPLIASVASVPAPTVGVGAVSLGAPLVPSGATTLAPTVGVGAVALTVPHVSSTATVPAPTVTVPGAPGAGWRRHHGGVQIGI